MGYSIYSNAGIKNYGIKHLILDTKEDFKKLPIIYMPGTTAFIIETSDYYMLNNKKVWCKVNLKDEDDQFISITYDGGENPWI